MKSSSADEIDNQLKCNSSSKKDSLTHVKTEFTSNNVPEIIPSESHDDEHSVEVRNDNKHPSPTLKNENMGLFAYAPQCCRNIILTPCGVLFFLCWASTMQVRTKTQRCIGTEHLFTNIFTLIDCYLLTLYLITSILRHSSFSS